jgi:hypothetical protein
MGNRTWLPAWRCWPGPESRSVFLEVSNGTVIFRGDWDRVGGLECHGRVATRDADRQDHDGSRRPRETLVKPCDSEVRGGIPHDGDAPTQHRERRGSQAGCRRDPTGHEPEFPGYDRAAASGRCESLRDRDRARADGCHCDGLGGRKPQPLRRLRRSGAAPGGRRDPLAPTRIYEYVRTSQGPGKFGILETTWA